MDAISPRLLMVAPLLPIDVVVHTSNAPKLVYRAILYMFNGIT